MARFVFALLAASVLVGLGTVSSPSASAANPAATNPFADLPNLPPGQKVSPEELERMRQIWQLRALQQRSGRHGPTQGVMPPIINGGPPSLPSPTAAPPTGKSKKRKSATEKRAEAKLQAAEKKRQKKDAHEVAQEQVKLAERAKPNQPKPKRPKPANPPTERADDDDAAE